MVQYIYTPIIKGKKNDLLALGTLSAAISDRIKPLIELPPTPSKDSADGHLAKFLSNLTHCSGNGNIFVDFYGFLPGEKTHVGHLATVEGYDLLHNAGKHVTPVYGFGRDDSIWEHLQRIVQEHNCGFCFRLEEDDLEEYQAEATWEEILTRSTQLGLDIGNVDLVLDLRDVRSAAADEKASLITDFMSYQPYGIHFRSIAIAGSSAPKDVTIVKKDSVGNVFRNELKIWANLKVDLAVGDELIYADYGVVHPDFAADALPVGGTANCKIRYTLGRNILIFRGHKRAGDSGQPHALAKQVCSHPGYCGRPYSFGDEYIDDVADFVKGPGNLGNWICADMSHHLTFATKQIDHLRANISVSLSKEDMDALLDEIV